MVAASKQCSTDLSGFQARTCSHFPTPPAFSSDALSAFLASPTEGGDQGLFSLEMTRHQAPVSQRKYSALGNRAVDPDAFLSTFPALPRLCPHPTPAWCALVRGCVSWATAVWVPPPPRAVWPSIQTWARVPALSDCDLRVLLTLFEPWLALRGGGNADRIPFLRGPWAVPVYTILKGMRGLHGHGTAPPRLSCGLVFAFSCCKTASVKEVVCRFISTG